MDLNGSDPANSDRFFRLKVRVVSNDSDVPTYRDWVKYCSLTYYFRNRMSNQWGNPPTTNLKRTATNIAKETQYGSHTVDTNRHDGAENKSRISGRVVTAPTANAKYANFWDCVVRKNTKNKQDKPVTNGYVGNHTVVMRLSPHYSGSANSNRVISGGGFNSRDGVEGGSIVRTPKDTPNEPNTNTVGSTNSHRVPNR